MEIFVHFFGIFFLLVFQKNKVFQQISGLKIVCICFRIYLAFKQTKMYVKRIYSFGYSDSNVGGGVKFIPCQFFTFFSLPGIGLIPYDFCHYSLLTNSLRLTFEPIYPFILYMLTNLFLIAYPVMHFCISSNHLTFW